MLAEILNIASAQSKTLTEEYQSRQEDLSKEIFEAEKLKSSIEEEMQTYVEESSQAESVLIYLSQKQSKFNEISADANSVEAEAEVAPEPNEEKGPEDNAKISEDSETAKE